MGLGKSQEYELWRRNEVLVSHQEKTEAEPRFPPTCESRAFRQLRMPRVETYDLRISKAGATHRSRMSPVVTRRWCHKPLGLSTYFYPNYPILLNSRAKQPWLLHIASSCLGPRSANHPKRSLHLGYRVRPMPSRVRPMPSAAYRLQPNQ
jgi:hypothetical protein